jgi:hypothetical protein
MRGPEGRPPNVSPVRKGWGINPEDDLSAVGAALNVDPLRYLAVARTVDAGVDPGSQLAIPCAALPWVRYTQPCARE